MSETKRKLVDAGVHLMRARGYNATTVEDICTEAGVTKGGFFHYFKSKDEIANAALAHFFELRAHDYELAEFRKLADPLDRVFGRLDYVKRVYGGEERQSKGCLIGVVAQELAFTNPVLREVCQQFFNRIVDDFSRDLAEAKAAHRPDLDFDPKAVARLHLAIVQGSLILAKTSESSEIIAANVEQFRIYLQNLFGLKPATKGTTEGA